jgi:hypothetical protein
MQTFEFQALDGFPSEEFVSGEKKSIGEELL